MWGLLDLLIFLTVVACTVLQPGLAVQRLTGCV